MNGTDQHHDKDEDEYDSAADEDFNPESAEARQADDASSSLDDDDEPGNAGTGLRHLKGTDTYQDELCFENSGDESTIQSGRRKKRKTHHTDEDAGGEGGLIKTRAQKMAEKNEKKTPTNTNAASVDVDALWAQMTTSQASTTAAMNGKVSSGQAHTNASALDMNPTQGDLSRPQEEPVVDVKDKILMNSYDEPIITIKRKVEFAGQVTEEERQVPASSAEAKIFLEQQQASPEDASKASTSSVRRPTKRKSMFDRQSQQLDSNVSSSVDRGKKLTTLEKSKLDWAAHVDKEGIADELDVYSKGKNDYLGRVDFLNRMDAKREGG